MKQTKKYNWGEVREAALSVLGGIIAVSILSAVVLTSRSMDDSWLKNFLVSYPQIAIVVFVTLIIPFSILNLLYRVVKMAKDARAS